jgi:hypothetical protein
MVRQGAPISGPSLSSKGQLPQDCTSQRRINSGGVGVGIDIFAIAAVTARLI